MLQGKFHSIYRKKETGTVMFRYLVSGTKEELEQYEEAQGEYFTPDTETGKPLFFSQRFVADDVNFIFTKDNRVVIDDSEAAKLQSLVDQYGLEVAQLIMSKK